MACFGPVPGLGNMSSTNATSFTSPIGGATNAGIPSSAATALSNVPVNIPLPVTTPGP